MFQSHTVGPTSWLVASVLAIACKPTETTLPHVEQPDPVKAPSAPVATASPPKSLSLSPLPAPAAYFQELSGFERVVDPVTVSPVPGSNVLLIVIDALNAKHLGAYGYPRATSPNIDALARDGLLLTNYVANSSWTRPTTATILTGLPHSEHRMALNCPPLSDEITTLAERFAEAGYRTGGFVGNPLVRSKWGYAQGFGTYVDVEVLEHYELADDADITHHAAAWLGQSTEEPFFAFVFLTSPHTPYRFERKHRPFFKGLRKGHIIQRPHREYPGGMSPGDREWTVAAYDSEIRYADAQLGILLDRLRASKLLENTTVIVTADHGEIFGQHDCFTHTYHMWEPVLRVPFVLISPALPVSQIYDDRPFTHLDITPTLLDLVGIDPAGPELTGVSIGAALADPRIDRDRALLSPYDAHGIRREAIRKGRWKLVHHHQVDASAAQSLTMFQGDPNAPPRQNQLPTVAWNQERYELFDIATDPGENTNLFEQRKSATETAELVGLLMQHLESAVGAVEMSVEFDDDLEAALKALGYLATDPAIDTAH